MNLAKKSRETLGAALLIVLAFVVLLSGIVVAYLSRTTSDRQLAHGTFSENRADILARSALDIVIGDLKQEIINGSTSAKDNSGGTMYIPSSSLNAVPQRSGNVDTVPNLIRRSVYPDAITGAGVASRASAVNSTAPALNGRTITTTRWNSNYLIPKINTTDDSVPISDFLAPDWVIVTRNGPTSFSGWDSALKNSTAANSSYGLGRYAYAIYDEGGLLDINVAGFPTNPTAPAITDTGRKGIVTFADLTALPTTPSASFVTNTVINRIVGWRNYQTMQLSGNFPNTFNFTFGTTTNFVNYFLGAARTGTSANFGVVASAPPGAATGDQGFLTRKELIKLRSDTLAGAASMLQYLGTFSREPNSPTWRYSSFPTSTNYLVSTRFPLSNLAAVVPGSTSIQPTFGLIWASDHWQYVGTSGRVVQQSITPPVAGAPADFFQILSFARTSDAGVAPTISQTLSIGASIIDQYDSDSITTKIEYQASNGTQAYAYGMESAVPPTPADAPAAAPASSMLNRPFRNVGELGYAFKNSDPATTLDFKAIGTPNGTNIDAGLLDFFTYNVATPRSGSVSLNTRNAPVLAAVLMGALPTELATAGVSRSLATTAANQIVAETMNVASGHGPAQYRSDVTRLAAVTTGSPFSTDEENRETVTRALAELGQTRTWGLLIDIVAQSGRYPPTAAALQDFIVEGEKRYWLHVAIDRFTGEVIDQQLEAVYE